MPVALAGSALIGARAVMILELLHQIMAVAQIMMMQRSKNTTIKVQQLRIKTMGMRALLHHHLCLVKHFQQLVASFLLFPPPLKSSDSERWDRPKRH